MTKPSDHSGAGWIADMIFQSAARLLIALLLLTMVAINLANVIGRHVFGEAIFWSEEIMRLLMIWGVFIGAAIVTYRGDHLRMDLFSANLPPPWSIILNGLTFAVLIGVMIYIMSYSYQVVQIISSTGRVSNAAKYPMVIQHVAVLIGLILIVAAALIRWRLYLYRPTDEA